MEGEGGGATVASALGGGGGSGGSEGDKLKPVEGEPKIKRKMKTTAQLETLETTYAVEQYPSEGIRAELSVKLGLSDRQLQMWFCHRRLKDRKAKTRKVGSPAPANAGAGVAGAGAGDELMLGSHSGGEIGGLQQPEPRVFHHQPGAAVPRIGFGGEIPVPKRYYEPTLAISELRAIAFVEAQLGEPIKEDGPILGMEFDPLPPGPFHTPIVSSRPHKPAGRLSEVKIYERLETSPNKDARRAIREYQFLPEQPSIRNDAYDRALPSHYNGSPTNVHGNHQASSVYNVPIQLTSLSLVPQQGKPGPHISPASGDLVNIGVDASYGSHPTTGMEGSYMTPERRIMYDEERLEKKRKSEEAKLAREVEAHEKRIRKELEKQDLLRRKREEQIKKEMERQDRERRKEEERLLREKLREEERCQREQRREMERRERFLQKESMRAEKMKLKEELRKEREAAKLKAANDRATARRFVKESIDLIEDEQLELMELVAANKELSSISALDVESLKNLESFRDMLSEFPVKSVRLKRPFSIQPWIDSEENVGNLLMVWRFLINFADVLTLWPFTLDEFLQAFHDYDTRLLGEVHIALLRTIIRDIEDVARTPATAPGVNQSSAVSAGGGHPHIVEGAYTWGFDIKSWQSHLNPLTWPEILRQFALSAGFGPKLKKRSIDQAYLHDENEDNDGTDIITNLRNGVAAENALAIMQERGLSNPRRSRHCLTPGTVKFAAFHILSLEGSKGITILEVAEKIQKSGLRDLTTSKTPEASISAALSRDTKLFERTAPSTYCVRAPYRKDPEDSEAILAAAREKVEVFKNGHLENGEEEKENVERDEDSESDEAENPEVSDLKGNGNVNCREELMDGTSAADEKNVGEPWVQGLTEGEYSDLTVQERLDALVALISVANEGNSIRVVLEERLEAANALKKQMWAEAQLDKRRMKEDYSTRVQYSSYTAAGPEGANLVIQKGDMGSPQVDPNLSAVHEIYGPSGTDNLVLQQSTCASEMSRSQLKSYIGHRAEEMYVYRSLPLGQDRRRNRYWQFITSSSQNDPGSGRIFIELRDGRWRLIDSIEDYDALVACLDVRGFRESHLHSMLQKIEVPFKETVKRNLSGNSMDSPKSLICVSNSDTSEPSSSFLIGIGLGLGRNTRALERYQEYEKWMWEECLNPTRLCGLKYGNMRCKLLLTICDYCHSSSFFEDNHCPSCHRNYSSLVEGSEFSEHVVLCRKILENELDRSSSHLSETPPPLRIRLLKAQLASIEAFIPPEALEPIWSDEARKFWGMKLQAASSAEDLLQILTSLEGVIRKDFLSSNYETTKDLLVPCNLGGSVSDNSSQGGAVTVLPWIPETTSAVALRLMGLDTSICYTQQQKEESQKNKASGNYMALPPKYAVIGNVTHDMLVENLPEGENARLDSLIAGRGRGRGRGGRRRGCRSGRSKQKVAKQAAKSSIVKTNKTKIIFKRTLISGKQEPSKEQTATATAMETIPFENAADICSSSSSSSSDRSPSDYDNAPATPATVDEYDSLMIVEDSGGFSRKPGRLDEDFDYNIGEEDDNCSEEESYHGESDDEEEEEGKRSNGGDQFANMDEDSRYSSSDYSD